MKFNNDDTVALGKLKAEGAEFITVEPSYVQAAKQATRAWEDKTSKELGGWFTKVLESQRAFVKQWEVASQYRSELK
jgi:hypothetical protein